MPRFSLDEIKQQKHFYRDNFRRAVKALVLSILIGFILIMFIIYKAIQKPTIAYYATHGETAPVRLTPLDSPNRSSEPLLADDPPDDMSKELGIQ